MEEADHVTSKDHSSWSAGRNQRCLSQKGMIGLIAILSAFVPHSTDIYLPSLPGVTKYFGVSSDLAKIMGPLGNGF